MKAAIYVIIAGVIIGGGIAASLVLGPQEGEEMADILPVEEEEITDTPTEKIRVVASFYPYYEFTRNVAGERAKVTQYLPDGLGVHDWEPTAQDLANLRDVDIFVYNGLGTEPYVDALLDSGEYDDILFVSAATGVETMRLSDDDEHARDVLGAIKDIIENQNISKDDVFERIESLLGAHEKAGHEHGGPLESIEELLHEVEDGGITTDEAIAKIVLLTKEDPEHGEDDHDEEHGKGNDHDHGHFDYDPHIWLDPVLVKQQVENIRDALVITDPENAEHYTDNAAAYIEKLDSLDADIVAGLSDCKRDTIVPFHNAFSYFATRYNLNVYSIGGLVPDAEATASEIAEFVDFVRENEIRTILSEEVVDARLAQVIASEAGAGLKIMSPIEALTLEDKAAGSTFISKMYENLTVLEVALDCQ